MLDVAAPTPGEDETLRGEVLWIDHFGNLVTNIPAALVVEGAHVVASGIDIGPVVRSYCDVAEGELLAMIGSFGHLEIAMCMGSAAEALAAERGAEVVLRPPRA
jgi:hypothetical protein